MKYINLLFYRLPLFVKNCWNGFCGVIFVGTDITRNHQIVNNTSDIFTIFTTTCSRILDIIFFQHIITAGKMFKYGVFSSPYFPVFRQNTEIYGVNLCTQSECRKIRTRKNSIFEYFSRSTCSFVFVDSHQPLSLFHS